MWSKGSITTNEFIRDKVFIVLIMGKVGYIVDTVIEIHLKVTKFFIVDTSVTNVTSKKNKHTELE